MEDERKEALTEKEMPNETDVRLLFGDMKKAAEALQRLFAYELEKLSKDNIDVGAAYICIESENIRIRLGNQVLNYTVIERVYETDV